MQRSELWLSTAATGLSDSEGSASESELELLEFEASASELPGSVSELLEPGLGQKLRPAGSVLDVRSRAPAVGEEKGPAPSLSVLAVAVSAATLAAGDCSSGCTASPAEEGPSASSALQI